MPEWWTYSPGNFLMFSARTYYRLLERHNHALWPAHLVALAAGGAVLWLMWRRPGARADRLAAGVLAAGWLLVAWAYFQLRYATIHPGGPWFAGAFALQGLALGWVGLVRGRNGFAARSPVCARVGLALFGAAVLLYPLVGRLMGRPWGQAEVFGLAPDPTVLATLGLLLATRTAAWWLWLVPVGWGLFSGLTLWPMESPEAWVVLPVVLGSVILAGCSGRRKET